jgi:hypothetical protein
MSNVHLLPDYRLSKAVDDIVQILHDIDPPIHTLTALGILKMAEVRVISDQVSAINEGNI